MLSNLLLSICGGMFAVLAFAPVRQIAWRFLRLVGYLTLALSAGAFSAAYYELQPATRAAVAALMGVSVMVVFTAGGADRLVVVFRGLCAAGGLVGVGLSLYETLALALSAGLAPAMRAETALMSVSQVVGSLFLGSITLAWLLGHAYLTATTMTIAPLRFLSEFLLISVTARLGLLLASVFLAWQVGGSLAQRPAWSALLGTWLLGVLRVGVGLILVTILAWMVRDCVRLRATQSATGILYFASIAAYVGELANLQIIKETGWSL